MKRVKNLLPGEYFLLLGAEYKVMYRLAGRLYYKSQNSNKYSFGENSNQIVETIKYYTHES